MVDQCRVDDHVSKRLPRGRGYIRLGNVAGLG